LLQKCGPGDTIVCGVSPEGGVQSTFGRICEKVGFKPGVKVWEFWMMRMVNQQMGNKTGRGRGE